MEIVESLLGQRKYYRGCAVQEQWVFSSVEHKSGNMFLVLVQDCSAETSMDMRQWIKPGTTVVGSYCAAYRGLKGDGSSNYTVNCTIAFVDEHTGVHTNTIKGFVTIVRKGNEVC